VVGLGKKWLVVELEKVLENELVEWYMVDELVIEWVEELGKLLVEWLGYLLDLVLEW
jgi:hypothetical protein